MERNLNYNLLNKSSQTGGRSIQIFVSYGKEDAKVATEIGQALEKENYIAWLDKHRLLAGMAWRREIKKAIRESDYFLAVISTSSLERRGFIHTELKEALEIWSETPFPKVYLIPVRIDNCDLSIVGLENLHWVDIFDSNSHEITNTSWNRAISMILDSVAYGRGHISHALNPKLVSDIVKYKNEREAFEVNINNNPHTMLSVSDAADVRCQFADNIIVRLFQQVCFDGGFNSNKFTLIARGGFGRRYLTRNSDIDLTLLHTQSQSDVRDAEKLFDVFSTLLTDIWGEIKVAAMINTVDECVDHWSNFNSLAAFSSTRFICGDFSLYIELIEKWRKFVSEIDPLVIKEGLVRQRFFHDVEPNVPRLFNVKFCAGGLMEIAFIYFLEKFLKAKNIAFSGVTTDNFTIDYAKNFMIRLREEIYLITKTNAITANELCLISSKIIYETQNSTTIFDELQRYRLEVREKLNSLTYLIFQEQIKPSVERLD